MEMGHFTREKMHAYRTRSLAPDELLAACHHLDQCESCYNEFRNLAPAPGLTEVPPSTLLPIEFDEDDTHEGESDNLRLKTLDLIRAARQARLTTEDSS